MKAYLCTVGEKTTAICKEQLERYGFTVVVLDEKEPWHDKYLRFLTLALSNGEDCLRIDGDIIPNKNISIAHEWRDNISSNALMIQFSYYDFYRNDVHPGNPILYTPESIDIILRNWGEIKTDRPETHASRLKEINHRMVTWEDDLVGLHGFFQDFETMRRAQKNKVARGQIDEYDFQLAYKLANL